MAPGDAPVGGGGPRRPVRARHPAAFPGLELKAGSTSARLPGPHAHEAYQIGLVEAGATLFRYRGVQHAASAGELMVLHPGEVHENRTVGARSFRSAYVEPGLLRALGIVGDGPLPFVAEPVVRDRRVVALVRGLLDGFDSRAPHAEREERLAAALGALFGARGAAAGREHRAVRLARALIHERHATPLTLADLAAATGLHRNYLLNVFTREVGTSPHRYLTGVRVESAKRLLRRGMAVAEVAAATGFSDQSHLTREFGKRVLLTPGRYRPRPHDDL